MGVPLNDGLQVLATPERNHFFYGKLMGVEEWRKDQRHFDLKRSLVNRLVLGSGIVCGLGLEATGEERRVRVAPGAAFDGWGREIVSPLPVIVDAAQPTDDEGQPQGDPLDTGTVTIHIAYAEQRADPQAVLVPDCDHPGGCAPGTVREAFRLLVRPVAVPPEPPPECGFDKLDSPPGAALHKLLVERTAKACPESPADPSVPLGQVDLSNGTVDLTAGRRLVYGNALLYELILCLASRIDALEHP